MTCRKPFRRARRENCGEFGIRPLTRQAPALVLAAAAACAAAATANADPIAAKRAQAQQVLAQLQVLDASAMRANNAYEEASLQLGRLERSLRDNRIALGVARINLVRAQGLLARRLVAIYTTRDEESTLAVILGARSLVDLVDRVETVQSVSRQDVAVIDQVISFKREIAQRHRFLVRARRLQVRLVHVRAAAKQRVAAQVAHEQRLYQSVKAEIDQLVAQQRARQLAASRLAAFRAAVKADQQTSSAYNSQASAGGTAPPSAYGSTVASIAMRYLGVPYVWGGASPAGFDCSGLVMYVFAQVGISLPHYTGAQWGMGVPVSRNDLQPGDLVFFDGLGHVGIYIGGGEFVHAPQTGDVVKVSSLDEGWYAATYDGARRITG